MNLFDFTRRTMVALLRPFVEKSPRLTYAYRRWQDSKALFRRPVRTPQGFLFAGHAEMERGTFEPDETSLVSSLLPDVDVFVNIGANIGYYVCLARALGKKAIAVEPIPANASRLLQNLWANGWRDIEVHPIGLSDQPGIAEIYGGGTGASMVAGWANMARAETTLIPVHTLDDLLLPRLKGSRVMLLVDVEGAEHAMLRSATGVLGMEPKPIWMVEICLTEHQPKGIAINPHVLATFEQFWRHGYRAFTADAQRRAVERPEIEALVATGKDTLGTHNFLFLSSAGFDAPPVGKQGPL